MDAIITTVDARGQSCPGPLITLHRAMKEAPSGAVFELLATDPGAKTDVPSWSKLTGHELVNRSEDDGVLRYTIRKV